MRRASSPAFERVAKVGLELPGVTRGTVYGSPALKVGGKMFACIAINPQAEPDTLSIRMSFTDRDLLIRAEPELFYLRPHYVDSPCVLVRVKKLGVKRLRELLEVGHEFVSGGG